MLSRIRKRTATQRATACAVHAADLVEVVGESHRQEALRQVAARATDARPFLADLAGRARKIAEGERENARWFRAVLVCEPSNKRDRNAVAVYADGVGLIGYLNRDDAIDYQPIFASLKRQGCSAAACPAFLIGGEPGKPSYGALLCLSSAERIVAELDEAVAT